MQPLLDAELELVENINSKTCNACGVLKHVSDFHPNKTCTLGVVKTCRTCSSARVANWYSKNRDRRQSLANSRNQRMKQLAVDRFGNKCADCMQEYPNYVYQFHHIDPNVKEGNPSAFMTGTLAKMWKELDKCVMLCANCHIIRHNRKEGVNDSTTY